jgi:tRNA (cmo5U34)-methyltransferase
MARFEDSEWSRDEVAGEFMENADHYIIERRRMLEIVRSLYRHCVRPRRAGRNVRLLDLGSGDGALSHALLQEDAKIEATLFDASAEMLEGARRRLQSYPQIGIVRQSFQDLLSGGTTLPMYDMIVSALAIHHLDLGEKKALFSYAAQHLNDGGHFVNVDVVLAQDPVVEDWHMALWREWIREHAARCGPVQSFEHVPQQYKSNPDNTPDVLDEQLDALRAAGLKAVDCYYKYGVFAVYGGHK